MKIDIKTITASTLAFVVFGASAVFAGPPRSGGGRNISGGGNISSAAKGHNFQSNSGVSGNNGGQSFQSRIGTMNGNSGRGNVISGNATQSSGHIKIKTPAFGTQVSGSGLNHGGRTKQPLPGQAGGIGGGFPGVGGIKVPGIKVPGINPIIKPINPTGPFKPGKPLNPGFPINPGGGSGGGSNPSPNPGQNPNPGSGQNPSGNPGSLSGHHGGCHHHWNLWAGHIGHYVHCTKVVAPCVLPYPGCTHTTVVVQPWVPEIVLPGDLDLMIREVQIIRPADALNGPVYRVLIANNGPANLVGKGRFVLFGVNDNQPDQNTPAVAGEFNGLNSGETAVVDVLMPVEANHFPFLLVALETPQGFRDIHPENNLAQGEVNRLPVMVAAQ